MGGRRSYMIPRKERPASPKLVAFAHPPFLRQTLVKGYRLSVRLIMHYSHTFWTFADFILIFAIFLAEPPLTMTLRSNILQTLLHDAHDRKQSTRDPKAFLLPSPSRD
jgi:hypothetical protein